MKIQLIFSYDGSKFQGSQTQPHQNGVEDALAKALTHVGIFNKITSSSRTDKDVHANNQSASVECGEHFSDLERLKSLINRHARPHINVKFIRRVGDDFQPRFDAVARSYRYVISHDKFSVFRADYELFLPKFDTKKANELLSLFIGRHDFSQFMKTGSSTKSPVREIYKAFCYEYKNKTIIVFKANGFLRGQVRLMIAVLLKALGRKNGDELIKNQLENKATLTRIPAPPQGLYLNRVHYF
ncbi:tRNA pseudouridine(38-40) synthase TruA [Campylobacter gastrosuis]|uniref:tRNA pseudouridine synthase A n=1 Tax=Campylobacter gastrosuis TaxID=2974576 RepID=A0ABT7HQS7_9BACT|nr:tRNA pseudouridine(38-40) synthase TruA [Campylobacter gastrosuis]MDL0089220.1 tRNA pseudouridine(38-40) synthase TruA [Campylobacter gastrosuis]